MWKAALSKGIKEVRFVLKQVYNDKAISSNSSVSIKFFLVVIITTISYLLPTTTYLQLLLLPLLILLFNRAHLIMVHGIIV